MQLLEQIEKYQELLEKKDELAEATKANNKAIEDAKAEIAQTMIDEDCPKINYKDYAFSLSVKSIYSKKSEADLQAQGLDFFEVLREQGLGDLIQETVNSRTFQSTMKNMAEELEDEGGIPDELLAVCNVYEQTDILRRKDRSASLRKAKGE